MQRRSLLVVLGGILADACLSPRPVLGGLSEITLMAGNLVHGATSSGGPYTPVLRWHPSLPLLLHNRGVLSVEDGPAVHSSLAYPLKKRAHYAGADWAENGRAMIASGAFQAMRCPHDRPWVIWKFGLTDGRSTPLVGPEFGAWNYAPRREPTSERLAFISTVMTAGAGRRRLCILPGGETKPTVLHEASLMDGPIKWAPTGRRLIVDIYEVDEQERQTGGPYVVDADTGKRWPLADRFPAGWRITNTRSACWSPDGRSICISAHPKIGGPGLYRLEIDGTGFETLRRGQWRVVYREDPVWSPDGTRICYSREGDTTRLMVLDVESKRETSLYGDRFRFEALDWSPDGRWIAVERQSGSKSRHTLVRLKMTGKRRAKFLN